METPDMGKMTLLSSNGCRGWEEGPIGDAACPANDVTTGILSWANQPCPILGTTQCNADKRAQHNTVLAKQAWRMVSRGLARDCYATVERW